jgi:hypothetical protein
MLKKTLSLLALLLFSACDSSPRLDKLTDLPTSERAALDSLLANAGLTVAQLRPVGMLGLDKNPLSYTIKNSHLVGLRLSNVPLKNTDALASFPELHTVNLDNCQLSQISGLTSESKLVNLHLAGNKLTDLQGLPVLATLETLSVARNALRDLNALPKLPALHTLDLANNQLSHLNGVEKLPKLMNLNALNNPLQQAEAARTVRNRHGELRLPENLNHLAVGVNKPRPADESPSHFVNTLPKLDGTAISSEVFGAPVTDHVFEKTGRIKSLTGAILMGVLEGSHTSTDAVTIELAVKRGTLRLYLRDGLGYRYAEAKPDQPLRLHGTLMVGLNYHTVLASVDGPAEGITWLAYRR